MASKEQLIEAVQLLLRDKVDRTLRQCQRKAIRVRSLIYLLKFLAYAPMGASGAVAIQWYDMEWSQTILIIMPFLSAVSTFFLTQFNLVKTYESFEKARRKLKRLLEDGQKDLLLSEDQKEIENIYVRVLSTYQEIERDLSLSIIRTLQQKKPSGKVTKHWEVESLINPSKKSEDTIQPTEYITSSGTGDGKKTPK